MRRYRESAAPKPLDEWLYRRPDLTAEFRLIDGRRFTLAAISTTGAGERTANGVGVGSSEAVLRQRLPTARCVAHDSVRTCTTGGENLGDRQTDYTIRRGRVTEVNITIVFP
jgi:hypothetical protein